MLKKLSLILITLLISIFLTSPVAALSEGDIVMSVTPPEQELEIMPGKSYRGSVSVTNKGRLPFILTAEVVPFYVTESYSPVFNKETGRTALAKWTTLDQSEYMLQPGEETEVYFYITVPDDIPAGGQYAAIMLGSRGLEEDEGMVKLSTKMAAILYGHVNGGETRAEGRLVDYSLPGFIFNPQVSVLQSVENTGNIDFQLEQTMTITNFFTGEEVIAPDKLSADGTYPGISISTVLPETTRTTLLSWKGAPQLGLFRVQQGIKFLDKEYSFEKVVLLCPIWLFVIVISAIIAAIVLLVIKIVRKKYRKTEDLL